MTADQFEDPVLNGVENDKDDQCDQDLDPVIGDRYRITVQPQNGILQIRGFCLSDLGDAAAQDDHCAV